MCLFLKNKKNVFVLKNKKMCLFLKIKNKKIKKNKNQLFIFLRSICCHKVFYSAIAKNS